ncbi:hypothetical protein Rsub_01466 [Raphidocelis subcapitata]|uniref:Uncharacterized protein n=1 Tax=Raphidocelis subcapitata TaxID=307507 RepID=A0A2V0NVJ8_9CHLO|nr:hypothetical protein Rsub_01466 [Raphidocelis subcapitata]|eukprot:GBF88967.1 hypothetical protein Rsub_01466 [Raphidocelis subcapitata]
MQRAQPAPLRCATAPAPVAKPIGRPLAARRTACRAAGGGSGSGSGRAGAPAPADTAAPAAEEERYAYSDPVNKALGNFLPTAGAAADQLGNIDWGAPKAAGLPLQELARRFTEEFLKREWFVTGDVPPELFSDSFVFKDDSVATSGIRSYALGVRKLFDRSTARAELVAVEPDAAARALVVTWRLEGRVNLPFKPEIPPYVVITTLTTDDLGLICGQLDEFTVPGWRLLAGALLGAWAGPPPAPPAAELRAAAAVEGRPGVVST